MSKGDSFTDPARRGFLKGVTFAGAAALSSTPGTAGTPGPEARVGQPKAELPGPRATAVETEPPDHDPVNQSSSGGDFMVDVLRALDVDYISIMCASSFRGLHEAILNHGGNEKPEIISCAHEEIAVHIAQGYAKIEGKPMAMACHGVVGLQHASMAIYNAWCDKVPVIVMGGNILEANKRIPGQDWWHSAIDPGALVRDYVKWDDQPASLEHFAESAVRAYKIAMTPPMAPVMLSLDAELQENPIARDALRIPRLTNVVPPQGDDGSLRELAKMLVGAENPVIICDRMARTQAGMDRLVELAEILQCPVVDTFGRLNFPTRHPLNMSFRRSVIGQADVVLALEMNDLWGAVNAFHDRIVRTSSPTTKSSARIVTISSRDLFIKSNYQDFGRYQEVDLAIAGDAEASLPALIEQLKRLVDDNRKSVFAARGKKLAEAKAAIVENSRSDATIGWDATPITTARLCAELYSQIKDEDWSLAATSIRMTWPHKLWNFDKTYQWGGYNGGGGQGYTLPGSLGVALANKRHGRLTVAIGGDGDFLFAPSTLWTAAHHQIPMLYIVHNNHAYHQEYMYLQAMAARHGRGITQASIGTTITDPDVDFATLAKGFGVYAEGPITDPGDLAGALKRALAVVKSGKPAVLDVVMDPR